MQRAEIERLHDHARVQLALPNYIHQHPGKDVRWRSELRMAGITLDLDVELNIAATGKIQHFVKRRDASAGHKSLPRKARVLQSAAVALPKLGPRKIANSDARV